uniref:Uncharacterized protein n=1 Tax=Globodera rostochiensis TaxID=31243 RepID=A0A914HLR7_GLORO
MGQRTVRHKCRAREARESVEKTTTDGPNPGTECESVDRNSVSAENEKILGQDTEEAQQRRDRQNHVNRRRTDGPSLHSLLCSSASSHPPPMVSQPPSHKAPGVGTETFFGWAQTGTIHPSSVNVCFLLLLGSCRHGENGKRKNDNNNDKSNSKNNVRKQKIKAPRHPAGDLAPGTSFDGMRRGGRGEGIKAKMHLIVLRLLLHLLHSAVVCVVVVVAAGDGLEPLSSRSSGTGSGGRGDQHIQSSVEEGRPGAWGPSAPSREEEQQEDDLIVLLPPAH